MAEIVGCKNNSNVLSVNFRSYESNSPNFPGMPSSLSDFELITQWWLGLTGYAGMLTIEIEEVHVTFVEWVVLGLVDYLQQGILGLILTSAKAAVAGLSHDVFQQHVSMHSLDII